MNSAIQRDQLKTFTLTFAVFHGKKITMSSAMVKIERMDVFYSNLWYVFLINNFNVGFT